MPRRNPGALAALVLLAACSGKAEWFDGTMQEALSTAAERETVLAVSVTAAWCPSCHELERRFWNTRHGLAMSKRYVLKLVDFDTEEGQRLVTRYSVISIPTTLVLDTEGHELGRIVGFEDVRNYRKTLTTIASRTTTPSLEGMEKRYARTPDDLQLALELGEAYLSAGLERQGKGVLEKVIKKDATNKAGAYMDATRILGRYYVRCRQDYYYGTQYFQAAVDRFPDAKEVWEFRYWIGQAIWKSGREDEALEYFAKLAEEHGDEADAHAIRARFLELECTDLESALASIRKAIELEPEDDWNCYVEAEILRKLGRNDEAMRSLQKAISLSPEKMAIYEDRREEWAR